MAKKSGSYLNNPNNLPLKAVGKMLAFLEKIPFLKSGMVLFDLREDLEDLYDTVNNIKAPPSPSQLLSLSHENVYPLDGSSSSHSQKIRISENTKQINSNKLKILESGRVQCVRKMLEQTQ